MPETLPNPTEAKTETFPNLTVIGHPLIQHKLSFLRARETSTKLFKELVDEISMLMAYEVTRDLEVEPVDVETPLETAHCHRIRGKKLAIVPILRAGLGMVDGILRLMPGARVGHIGLYRNETTLEPVEYFMKLPPDRKERDFILVDPMLATGGSASAAVTMLRGRGAARIRFMCLVAAPQGVRTMLRDHPDVPVFAAALDDRLDENGYIRPGLGDAGDRLFGTR
jgi:uracil phosphoribosyltransferase